MTCIIRLDRAWRRLPAKKSVVSVSFNSRMSVFGFRATEPLSVGWSDIYPDDTPLLLRNVGTYEIYALELQRK